jgi:hypothetical protein
MNDKAFEKWFDKYGGYYDPAEGLEDHYDKHACKETWDASGEYHTKKAIDRCIEILENSVGNLIYIPNYKELVKYEIKKEFNYE